MALVRCVSKVDVRQLYIVKGIKGSKARIDRRTKEETMFKQALRAGSGDR